MPAEQPQEAQPPLFVDDHQRIVGPSGEPLLDAAGRPLFVFGGRVVTGEEDELVHLKEPYDEASVYGDEYCLGGEYMSMRV